MRGVAAAAGTLLLVSALGLVALVPKDAVSVSANNGKRMLGGVQQRQMLIHEHLHYGLPNELFIPSGDEPAQKLYGGGGWFGGFDPSYTLQREGEDFSPYTRTQVTRGYDAETMKTLRMLGKTGTNGVPFDYKGPDIQKN